MLVRILGIWWELVFKVIYNLNFFIFIFYRLLCKFFVIRLYYFIGFFIMVELMLEIIVCEFVGVGKLILLDILVGRMSFILGVIILN